MKITTNNKPRDVLYWWELTDKERMEFDWLDSEDEQDSATFFRYKGEVYCLSEFMRIEHHPDTDFSNWHGYLSDSFFSGILVKYPEDDYNDTIIVGWYYS